MPRWRRAIVVGASSGIGRALAERLAAEGTAVALLARRQEELNAVVAAIEATPGHGSVRAVRHDVRDTDNVSLLMDEIAGAMGGLDLVVYAAGVQPRVAPSAYPTADDLETIAVNFAGAVAWLNAAADRFGRAGEGTIVGISSVAGDRGRRGNPVYGATKAALATYLESLRNRLAARGVTVTTVKPGFVATRLLESASTPPFVPVLPPAEAARQILAAAAGRRVVYIPGWWRAVMWAIRAVPSPIFERLNV